MKFSKMIYFLFIFCFQLLNFSGCKTKTAEKKAEAAEPISAISENQAPEKKESLQRVMKLPKELKECSGMVDLGNNKFVAHNDSGNKPYLYIFNSDGKKETRIVKVTNVKK